MEELKKRYVEIWRTINRPVEKFLTWLEHTDFYTAPASTRYHLSEKGGLLLHSLNVYDCLKANVERLGFKIDPGSVVICGLGHDICKADFYAEDTRNVKKNGVWVQEPYYTVNDKFPFGHGEKSAFILRWFFSLTKEEVLAIRWHMGGFTPGITDFQIVSAYNEAMKVSPLVPLLHLADMEATWIKESFKIENKEESTNGNTDR